MTPEQQMAQILKAFPYARQSGLRAFFIEWDANALDEWASGAEASEEDRAIASFILDILSEDEWKWKARRYSLRRICSVLSDEDRAPILRYIEHPFFLETIRP